MSANKDLLLCENKYFLEKNNLKSLLSFKNGVNTSTKLNTEKISSNGLFTVSFEYFLIKIYLFLVLSRVKEFMNQVEQNDQECVNIEEKCNVVKENEKLVQLDVLLFEQEDVDNSDTSDYDSDE